MIKNHWHIALKSKDLGFKKPQAVTMFEASLVLFRDNKGNAAALIDNCPHRNMPLSAGKICGNSIECPYHGWRFAADGTLAALPALPDKKDWPQSLKAKSYPCYEQDGYIWLSLADTPPSEPPPKLPYKGEKGWQHFDMVTYFEGSVENCLENFLDCPHAAHVHKSWFRSPTGKAAKAIIRTEETGAVAEYFDEPREKSLVWRLFGRHKAGETQMMQHTDRYIAPSTSRVEYIMEGARHYLITSHCTPITPTKTIVYTHISLKTPLGLLAKIFFAPISRLIIQQDVAAMQKQQKNIKKFGGARFTYAKSDLLIRHIIRWRQAIEKNEPPPKEGEERHVTLAF